MIKLTKKAWLWYALAALVLVLDQASKMAVSQNLAMHTPVVFTSFFNFTLMHNYGAAFSFLGDAGGWQRYFLGLLALAVSIGLVVWLARTPQYKTWEPLALALVLGGALGNLYDRATLGYVVDFIVVHYRQYYWPAFNVADMAICCGAIMLLIDAVRSQPPAEETQNTDK